MFKSLFKKKMKCDYRADGLGVKGKSTAFMQDAAFQNAWEKAVEAGRCGWSSGVPDIRWRAHMAIWAAQNSLKVEGDFVECGVYTGLLSLSICHYTNFQSVNKRFWLYDTWQGIPDNDKATAAEKKLNEKHNKKMYHAHDVYETVRSAFSVFPNVKMVRGILPDTLADAPEKIAYMSIDLNHAGTEMACINKLWDRVSNGAFIVLDDYGFTSHAVQRYAWDDFAKANDQYIATLPTGQGLLIKTA